MLILVFSSGLNVRVQHFLDPSDEDVSSHETGWLDETKRIVDKILLQDELVDAKRRNKRGHQDITICRHRQSQCDKRTVWRMHAQRRKMTWVNSKPLRKLRLRWKKHLIHIDDEISGIVFRLQKMIEIEKQAHHRQSAWHVLHALFHRSRYFQILLSHPTPHRSL